VSPPQTLQRLERILVVVPWLLQNPGATVREVTKRFGMTREELTQDLDVLGYCGLPGYGGGDLIEATIYGDRVTVRLADYFRRPLTLSRREALTLLLAASALADVPGLPESAGLRSALVKLRAILGVEAQVAVSLAAEGDEHLAELRKAVADSRVVHLRYRSRSKQETTERDVEPWAVVAAQGTWYLQGWCRLATAPRAFRLDGISVLTPTGEKGRDGWAPRPAEPPPPPVYVPSEQDQTVVLDLDPAAWCLPERLVVDRTERLEGYRRIHLRTGELEWVARIVLALTPAARVVQPPALAGRVAQLARDTLSRYA